MLSLWNCIWLTKVNVIHHKICSVGSHFCEYADETRGGGFTHGRSEPQHKYHQVARGVPPAHHPLSHHRITTEPAFNEQESQEAEDQERSLTGCVERPRGPRGRVAVIFLAETKMAIAWPGLLHADEEHRHLHPDVWGTLPDVVLHSWKQGRAHLYLSKGRTQNGVGIGSYP